MWQTLKTAVPKNSSPTEARPFDAFSAKLSTVLNSDCRARLIMATADGPSRTREMMSGSRRSAEGRPSRNLYTPEQRLRRDASPWTFVQGVLAPIQFAIFFVSLGLIIRFLMTGTGLAAATVSVVAKTIALYAIMITGSIWERDVFGRYLFADAFYWEDMVSMLVLALHTLYLGALLTGTFDARQQMLIALAAYAAYVVNATQFLLKLRAARSDNQPKLREVADDPWAVQ